MDFDVYELVLLRQPPDPTTYDEAELDRLHDAHLSYFDQQVDAGLLVLAGPVWQGPDERLRGICVYRVGDLDRVRAIANEDPAVKAGRLEAEVMHFTCPAGIITALPHSVPDHDEAPPAI